MLPPSVSKLFLGTILVFVVVHAWIAFGYTPAVSDTNRYAMYAFMMDKAERNGRTPYDEYESSQRATSRAHGLPTPRADEMTVEYPPLALAMLRAPLAFVDRDAGGMRGRIQRDWDDWTRGFRGLYFFAHASVLLGMAVWQRRRGAACTFGLAVSTLAGLALLYVLYDRLDLALGLVLLGALAALLSGHRYLALAMLAVAVNLKLVPIFLLPLFVIGALPATALTQGLPNRSSLPAAARATAGFAATGLAMFLPFRLAWGPRVWDFLAYHGQRGFQIESTWSSVLLLAARFGYPARVERGYGADELAGPGSATLAKASVVVVLGLVLVAYAVLGWALRRSRSAHETVPASRRTLAEEQPQLFVWGSVAVLAAAMVAAKVFSPQYLCWFLPLLILIDRPGRARDTIPFVVLLAACGLTALVFPVLWHEVIRGSLRDGKTISLLPTLPATLLMLTRNVLWIGFAGLALRQAWALRAPAPAAPPPSPSPARRRRRHRRR